MFQKNQRKWCYFIVLILLMAGIHTTYVRADDLAEHAAFMEAAKYCTANGQEQSVTLLKGTDSMVPLEVCVVI